MRTIVAFIVALTLSAPAALAQTPDIQNPIWLAQPDAPDFAQNYPAQAAQQAVEGRATIECFVRLDTTLDCSVITESPASWGFGDATLAVARTFRVAPAQVNGEPTEGGRIRRTVRWVMPPEERNFEGASPEERAFIEAMLPPILPSWEEAPTTQSVLRETPEAAADIEGRGVLSCRVNEDRSLRCRRVADMPSGRGFGAAALRLSRQFRVAQSSEAFIAQHRSVPFILPISFGSAPAITPVNRMYRGPGPVTLPPIQTPQRFIPPAAVEAHVRGAVIALCTVEQGGLLGCVIEHETPTGFGFAAVAMEALAEFPPAPADAGVLTGDQIRFTFEFAPD